MVERSLALPSAVGSKFSTQKFTKSCLLPSCANQNFDAHLTPAVSLSTSTSGFAVLTVSTTWLISVSVIIDIGWSNSAVCFCSCLQHPAKARIVAKAKRKNFFIRVFFRYYFWNWFNLLIAKNTAQSGKCLITKRNGRFIAPGI